jgi:hypothetical protein
VKISYIYIFSRHIENGRNLKVDGNENSTGNSKGFPIIFEINKHAFGQPNEVELVDLIRNSP